MTASSTHKVFSLPSPRELMAFTGERYTLGVHGQIEHEHLHRYFFVLQFCKEMDVLDIASGEGYGSALLSQVARSIVGVDIDAASVGFANDSYAGPNLSYKVGSASQLPVADASVDVVVSFETIEHFAEHEAFLAEIKRVLRPGGLLVMSSPDRDVYSGPGTTLNPFHVRELNKTEFHDLIRARFEHAVFGCQKSIAGSLLLPDAGQEKGDAPPLESFGRQSDTLFERETGIPNAVYLLAIASDQPLPAVHWGALDDSTHIARLAGEVAAKDSELLAKTQELTAKDAELAQGSQQIESFRAQLTASEAELAIQKQQFDALEAELAIQKQQFDALSSELQLRMRGLEMENQKSSGDLIKTRIALHKAQRRSRKQRWPKWFGRHRFRESKAAREQRQAELIRASGMFDVAWYLACYPDVRLAGIDPVIHYLRHGAGEGRDPSPQFDTDWYLRRHSDVAVGKANPLVHYIEYGINEGRSPSPLVERSSGPGREPVLGRLNTGQPTSREAPTESGRGEMVSSNATSRHIRLVVLSPDAAERFRLSEELWPCVRIADPAAYSPVPGDYVYEPGTAGGCLPANHLHNAVLCLSSCQYDFVLISHGLDALPTVQVSSRANNLIVRGDLLPLIRSGHALPNESVGRVLRLVPAPQPGKTSTLLIGDVIGAACTTDGVEVHVGSKTGKPAGSVDLKILSKIKNAARDAQRKTVLVLPALFAVGGVERNTIEVMKKLQDGYRFVIATSEAQDRARGSLHHQLDGLAVGVFDLWEVAQPEHHLELLAALAKIYNVDLIWICNGSPWLAQHASELRRVFSTVPIVDQQVYDTNVGWITHFWNEGIRSFDRFIAINSRIRDTFINQYGMQPDRIDLVYHAIDEERFVSCERTRDDAKLFVSQLLADVHDVKIFAFVGRLTVQKRPLDFLELALRSRRDRATDIFVVIGSGELAGECRRFQEQHSLDNVRFIDFVEDMSRVYPALAGLIITSQYEGLPIVALEAMAMGVPILATDVGDLGLVFSQHGVGALFSAIGDPEAQYRSFRAWRDDLERTTPVALASASDIRERFSSGSVAKQYDACWTTVMTEGVQTRSALARSEVFSSPSVSGVSGISVVIPSYNRADMLIHTLQNCHQNAGGVDLEFIVVDDGSTDGTAESMAQLADTIPNLRWKSISNGGPGQARNIGAAMATKDIVLFLGDDIQPVNDEFFKVHARLHEVRPEQNFAVLGKVIWPNKPDFPINFVMSHIQGRGGEQFGYAHLTPYTFVGWRHFYTCNISVKRHVVQNWIEEGFSKEFALAAFEDVEFAYRQLKAQGDFRIYFDPSSVATHSHHYTVDGFIHRQVSAGMMAHVFQRLHPEVAPMITVDELQRALGQPQTPKSDAAVADYISIIEGMKSYGRVMGQRPDFGGSHWHDDLLSAIFEVAYGQGFVMASSEEDANLAAAYELLLNRFSQRISKVVHREATGEILAIGQLLPELRSEMPQEELLSKMPRDKRFKKVLRALGA